MIDLQWIWRTILPTKVGYILYFTSLFFLCGCVIKILKETTAAVSILLEGDRARLSLSLSRPETDPVNVNLNVNVNSGIS